MLEMTDRLPSSATLAKALLEAAKEQRDLQAQYTTAWLRASIAKANKDMARAMAAHDFYVSGLLDAKNEQMRQVQLDGLIALRDEIRRRDQGCIEAQADLKEAEGELESAKLWRATLRDLVALRVSENGLEMASWQWGPLYGEKGK